MALRHLALVVWLSMSFASASTLAAQSGDGPVEEAEAAVIEARRSADEAASAMFELQSQLDQLEVREAHLELQLDELGQRADELRLRLEWAAIVRFTRSGLTALPFVTETTSPTDQAQVNVLMTVIYETSNDRFDDLDALDQQYVDRLEDVAELRATMAETRSELEQRQQLALERVRALRIAEEGRLLNAAKRDAALAREAEERREAGTDEQLVLDTTGPTGPVGELVTTTSAGASPSRPSGGGQTGVSGSGGVPTPSLVNVGSFGVVCPLQGPAGFADTWGAPRSGGRTHQGVDMIAERGVPVVAIVDGFAQQRVNELGGNTVSLQGADGNRYYYAHMDSWGAAGTVGAGTVIGYVGDSGNAQLSVPHLHLQIHPGGGEPVNPYPAVRALC